MKYLRLATALISFLLISCLYGQDKNVFQHLKQYAGEYKCDEFLSDPILEPVLKKMLGKQYSLFRNNISVVGPINLMGGDLVVSGLAPHQGGEEMSIANVDPITSQVTVGILSQERIQIYTNRKMSKEQFKYLPQSVKDWIKDIEKDKGSISTKLNGITVR